MLENQGLRATTRGGHRAIEDAARAQLVPPLSTVISGFGWMRQLRNASEYLSIDRATASPDDLIRAQSLAAELVDTSRRLLDTMPVY